MYVATNNLLLSNRTLVCMATGDGFVDFTSIVDDRKI